ncbi:6-phosphofructokinase [Candidatus Saganbacteria bacterium CG08_land_8_20_14_0_20_45_16]|uniref:ATP-dependent 6-phosphofructokinase n=1 Tax=Candidatus Saganbacteria bacterium CG08_land_8_20_14_0_20_45_16 TaxID=2014293 RepID=A0A2H0XVY8_UNCSA|nr:MAG: 6-phosphofructokinase [Candidatus Saganbacteria bacterium CG08_land_8_20_14_0_20_45_16]
MAKLKTIAVITPGGDAPGMNTAIRAVVRTAIFHGVKVWGIKEGWWGLMHDNLVELATKDVSGIINRGGTILHSRRCPEFKDKANRRLAYQNLRAKGIEGIVAIGGDGSMRASQIIMKETGLPVNVIPATIDNDIPGTDYTIGFDTAVNTAVEAIDKIRDTATSHQRLFVVEVMGRHNGFIALDVALVAGAEACFIPEVKHNINQLVKLIKAGHERGKKSFIIIVAEGAADSHKIVAELQRRLNIEVRLTILGHMQRGGVPTALSRELACKLGATAVELMIKGGGGYLIGAISDKICCSPINKIYKAKKQIDLEQLRIANMLAT